MALRGVTEALGIAGCGANLCSPAMTLKKQTKVLLQSYKSCSEFF